MKETILAISGRPGLFRLVGQGNRNLIVETLDAERKRMPAGQRDRVTSLGDVSMYSEEEDVPLMQVFQNLFDALKGQAVDMKLKTATNDQLSEVMAKALPNYDRDRVHYSDIRKLIQWYNILVREGLTDFVSKDEETAEENQ